MLDKRQRVPAYGRQALDESLASHAGRKTEEGTMNILQLLNQSDYIQINNQLIKPEYMYASMDFAEDDDVAVEAQLDGAELVLTVADLEDATPLADGAYWLESVGYLRFLSRQALH